MTQEKKIIKGYKLRLEKRRDMANRLGAAAFYTVLTKDKKKIRIPRPMYTLRRMLGGYKIHEQGGPDENTGEA